MASPGTADSTSNEPTRSADNGENIEVSGGLNL
jgi:hypothetical protein